MYEQPPSYSDSLTDGFQQANHQMHFLKKCLDEQDLIPECWQIKIELHATERPNDLVAQLVRGWHDSLA